MKLHHLLAVLKDAHIGNTTEAIFLTWPHFEGPTRLSDLCNAAGVTSAGGTYARKKLQAKGLITRIASQVDDRSCLVAPTEAGVALINRALRAAAQ